MAWKKYCFDYVSYFETIRPKTTLQIYNRFLFAFCSIHTSWQSNVRGYNLLKNEYQLDKETLEQKIIESRMGLINKRSKAIYEFTQKFLKNPNFFLKTEIESWQDYAERLEQNIFGLGPAKTRFVIELLYLDQAQVVCTDTHIIQWAKKDPNKMSRKLHLEIEQKFIKYSKRIGYSPVVSRWRYWDQKQNQIGSRYWSYCLEDS